MKISTNQYFRSMGQFISDQQDSIAKTQVRIAKGDNLATPSDGPKAATKSLDIKSLIKRNDDFLENLKVLDGRLSEQESIIISIRDLLSRVKEITLRAASSTYDSKSREAFSVEISAYRDEILKLSNSVDVGGAYIFAGIQNGSPPFVANDEGKILYQGDQRRVSIAVDAGQSMQLNATEDDLYPVILREGNGGAVEKVRIFDVLDDLASGILAENNEEIQRGLSEIDSAATGVDNYIVDIGVRRKVIETKLDITDERRLALTQLYARERELDYSKAVTELSAQMLALEAAQSSMAKVSQLTLFNYIK